jgi:signal transduction histidine kinase
VPETSGLDFSASYKLLQVLKRGPVAETMLALDRRTGVEVIVKVVAREALSPDARARLERESWMLKSLSSSVIAGVIDLVNDGDRLCVVMPYLDGMPLRRRLAAGPLSLRDSLNVASHVLRSLTRIHALGALHRDIRPANILVDEQHEIRSATLVDFGLASTDFLVHELTAYDTRYMAPELAGVLDRPVDHRSDLYSVGIVVFECLAGRPPFAGTELRDILRDQLSTTPPALRTLGIPVPQACEDVLRRLLHKDPDDRYHSAQAALADVEKLSQALDEGVAEPGLAVGANDRRQTLTEPPLTGRENEVALLHQRLAEAGQGVAAAVVLRAESGGGKTRVLDEFCQRASTSGARVLRGYGSERSGQRPLQMLTGLVDDLVRQAAADPGFAVEFARRLAPDAGPLCDLLPELKHLLSVTGSAPDQPDAAHPAAVTTEYIGRTRLVGILVRFLDSLGVSGRPALVTLDDCQWADELTLEVLEAWAADAADPAAAPRHVLLLAAARSEEHGEHRRLDRAPGIETLVLPALSADQISQVVSSMAGSVPRDATRTVIDLSRGNPLMVSAVLRGLVETKALAPSPSGWRLHPVPDGWQASSEAANFLARRFAVLEPATRRLLEAGAVIGRHFDLTLAAPLVGQSRQEAEAAVRQALERHIIWARDEQTFTFAHDRLRATLLAELPQADQTDLHRRAAEGIDSRDPSNAFRLAYHFDAAGRPERALRYAISAASEAQARHDFELAERQYRIAERGMRDATDEDRYRVAEGLGAVLTLRGRYDEAEERFERARRFADTNLRLAWIDGQLGELRFKRDDLEGATGLFEAGLRVLGESLPSDRFVTLVARLAWELLVRFGWEARSWLRRASVRRPAVTDRAEAGRRADRLKAYLYTRLQYPRWFHVRRLHTLCLVLRQINVAERCSDGVELAHAYSIWGGALSLTFPFCWRRALRYIDEGERIYRRHNDQRGIGHMASMRALALHAAGRYQEAIASADEAISILAVSGDRWELGFVGRTRAICLYRLGHFRGARDEARRVIDIGREVGDANAQVTGLEVLAKATGGKVSAAQTRLGLQHAGNDIEVTIAGLQAEALRLRNSGNLAEAVQHLETAVALVRRAQPSSTHLVPVLAWLATARREHAERPLLPHVREHRLRRARASARLAVRYAWAYPNDRPHALRELGVVHALMGHRRRARRQLRRSAGFAERSKALAELAETDYQIERLELSPHDLRKAVAGQRATPEWSPANLGLATRFAALLEAGVILASTDSSDEIGRAVRRITQSLLRAETCQLVRFAEESAPLAGSVLEGENALVQRAFAQRRPVVFSDFSGTRESSDFGNARSVLCGPVFVHDTPAGYFLALHSQVDELFGEQELQLAEFVGRLAGAALERQQHQHDSRMRVVAAQEAERARFARDLHDEIGQALTSVLLGVRLVESSVGGFELPSEAGQHVLGRTAELRRATTLALESVQRLAFDLRPAVLDDLGLVAAVRRLTVSAITGHTQVELEAVNLESGERLPTAIETAAYRIAQESITNTVRHAGAENCSVLIARVGQKLRVVVEDDGVGFVSESSASGGLGLQGMRERAALAGGRVQVDSTPGKGTSVVFEVRLES